MTYLDYFSIAAIQPNIYYCKTKGEILEKNLKRQLELVEFLVPYWSKITGAPCKLVVCPEFALQGFAQNHEGNWNGVGEDIPGEETELIGKTAKKLGVYIASHAWQEYPDLPGKPFSVAFLISPEGKVILKHHKVIVTRIAAAADAAPGDVYDWFTKKFGNGLDAFFPVADTELGKLGFQICGEGQYAETARALMMNGAEIIMRPNAWVEPFMAEPQDWMALMSRFNAFANMCYLVESNWANYYGPGMPEAAGGGRSQVIDYTGRLLARTYCTGESGVAAEINMQTLRRYREESSFCSRMVYMPTQIFRKIYETEMWPLNTLMGREGSLSVAEWDQLRRQVIEKRRDIYTRSERR